MIKTDYFRTRDDGVRLYRTCSDNMMMIRKDGTDDLYEEAVDTENSSNRYIETDIPIEDREEPTLEDTLSMLGELGVDTDD